MAINNLNPRRTVWFSPNEPSNKYDIWLSRNAHLDENGEPTTDSNSQRGCDYIFKIYDCGKWNPIVGFNSTALNKMNIVKGSPAYTGLEGNSHTDFQEFHLPLFRDPSYSPDELFDAGTVGTVIKEYVTSSDWYDIIHEGGLGLQIEQYYNDDPFELPPAGINLGGILMNRFSSSDLTPVSTDTNTSVLALAKYSTTYNDYHPYVNVKDIISIINTGSAGEISFGVIGSGGSGSSIDQLLLYNSFRHSRSIKRDWNENPPQTDALKPHFSIWGANNVENAGKLLRLRTDYEQWEQRHTGPYSESENALDWVDPQELFNEYSYELPLASLGARGGIKADIHPNIGLSYTYLAECKLNPLQPEVGHEYSSEALFVDVRDVKLALDNWYASNDSTVWDLNVGSGYGINTIKLLTYNPNTGITSNRYTHILDGYTSDTEQGLFCRTKYYENGNAFGNHYGLEWDVININDIADVSVSDPQNNLILLYNSYTGNWENGNLPKVDKYTITNSTMITVTGDLSETTYVFTLYPDYRYICTNPIEALSFFNYSNVISQLSYFDFSTTDNVSVHPVLEFDSTYEFIETYTINSTTYSSNFSYNSLYDMYILELKNDEKYVVTINGNKISIDEVSDKDSLFNVL